MTDQRSFRDPTLPEAGPLGTSTADEPAILDPSRTMLGVEQRDWLVDGLVSSPAQWKLIGSQLMFWPWRTVPRLPGQPRGSGTFLRSARRTLATRLGALPTCGISPQSFIKSPKRGRRLCPRRCPLDSQCLRCWSCLTPRGFFLHSRRVSTVGQTISTSLRFLSTRKASTFMPCLRQHCRPSTIAAAVQHRCRAWRLDSPPLQQRRRRPLHRLCRPAMRLRL